MNGKYYIGSDMMRKKLNFSVVLVLASVLCLTWGTDAADEDKPVTLDTDPSLAGWWKFDETSGKTAADSSKFGRKAR